MSLLTDRKAAAECIVRLRTKAVSQVLLDDEFKHFHQMRNVLFNDYEVTKLIEQPPYNVVRPIYKDQNGRIWVEETIGVKYHVRKKDWTVNPFKMFTDDGQTLRKWGREKKNRFSRKFLMASPLPGHEGASAEMIIKRDGTRIVSGPLMETFNYGVATARSSWSGRAAGVQMAEAGLHYKFDIKPHEEWGSSSYKVRDAKPVRIVDMVDLFESGDLDFKALMASKFN